MIRHVKPHKAQRRRYLPGRSILDDRDSNQRPGGRRVARRCRSCSRRALRRWPSLQGADGERSTRAYFAYGLASSFEAYADTRRNRVARLDEQRRRSRRSPPNFPASCAGTSTGSQPLFPTRHRRRLGHAPEDRRHGRPGA